MSILATFLNWRGRLSRQNFGIAASTLYALTMGLALGLTPLFGFASGGDTTSVVLPALIGLVILGVLVALYACTCIFAQRLHDLGLPGWLSLGPLAVFLTGAGMLLVAEDPPEATSPMTERGVVLLLLWATLVLACALRRGDLGDNRYGAPGPSLVGGVGDQEIDLDDEDDVYDDDDPDEEPRRGAANSGTAA